MKHSEITDSDHNLSDLVLFDCIDAAVEENITVLLYLMDSPTQRSIKNLPVDMIHLLF